MAAGPFRWGCGITLGILVAIVCFAVLGIAALIGGCGTCVYLGSQLPESTGPVGVPSREVSGPAQADQPPATQGAAAKESGTTQEAAAEKEFQRAAALSREGRYDLSAAAIKDILSAYPKTQAAEKARAILPSVEEKRVEAGQAEAAPSALPAAPKPGPERPADDTPQPPPLPWARLSLSGYNRIEPGMTYEEVIAIIGPPSQEVSRSHMEGAPGVMPSVETVMYVWEGTMGANMNAMFQNGRLVSKAQFGLR